MRGLTLRALAFGPATGRRVLAVHGWLDNAHSFAPLAAALPDLPYACGLGTASLLTGDVGRPSSGTRLGSLTAPTAPPAPDDDPRWVADPATTARWLDRLHRVAALAAQGADTDRDRMGS